MSSDDANERDGEAVEPRRRYDLVALVAGVVSAVVWVMAATGWDGDVGVTGRIAWSLSLIGVGLVVLFRRH